MSSKRCCRLAKYIKDAAERKIVYLDSQSAGYITDITVTPGKVLILLIIQ